MEFDFWPWVLIFAALYLLAGVLIYIVLEARCAGTMEPRDYFTPLEMALVILTWPAILLYVAQFYLRKWGAR